MKIFIVTVMMLFSMSAAEEPTQKEYRDLLREARSDSDSDSDSAEQIHSPQLGFGHPKLHVHHRKHHKHGDAPDAGHVLASWHHGDGHDKSSGQSSSSESQEGAKFERCTCLQTPTDFGTKTTTWYDPTTESPWYYTAGKRSLYNGQYATTYSGFRLKGELRCFCPEMHMSGSGFSGSG